MLRVTRSLALSEAERFPVRVVEPGCSSGSELRNMGSRGERSFRVVEEGHTTIASLIIECLPVDRRDFRPLCCTVPRDEALTTPSGGEVTSAASADRLIWPSIGCGARRFPPILRRVIGEEFASVLACAQHGDEAAFARLWLDVNPALVRYLRVVSGEVDEDVAAEAWVTVVRGLTRFRGDEMAWRGWVFTTARRRAVDEGRRRARQRAVHSSESAGLSDAIGQTAPSAAQEALECLDTEAALALVARLAPLQAEVIALRVIAGLDVESVARLVSRRPGAVRVAAHRGLRRLAQIMAKEGVTL